MNEEHRFIEICFLLTTDWWQVTCMTIYFDMTVTYKQLQTFETALLPVCKHLHRLIDDFFEILIFRVWERKIRWQKKFWRRQLSRKLLKTDTLTADKWVVWYGNWSFMTTDNFSATGRQTRTRSGKWMYKSSTSSQQRFCAMRAVCFIGKFELPL